MTEWANGRTGVDIHPGAATGSHFSSITGRVVIAANVFLMHSVPADSLVLYEEKQLSILDKKARSRAAALEWPI